MAVDRVLSAEGASYIERAISFAQEHLAPYVDDWERVGRTPRDVFTAARRAGLVSVPFAAEDGGAAQTYEVYLQAIEELAARAISVAFGINIHVTSLVTIRDYLTAEQLATIYARGVREDYLHAFCLSEPNAGSDPGALQTRAERAAGGYAINGHKAWVTRGGESDGFLVFARTGEGKRGISCLFVDASTPGIAISAPIELMGMSGSMVTDVDFTDVRVGPEALIGSEGDGLKIALSALDSGRLGVAMCAVGIAQAALDAAVAYAKQRHAFGIPIAGHQGLAFVLADMEVAVHSARASVIDAARRRDTGRTFTRQAAIAKLLATDAAMKVTTDAVQVLGGVGYTKGHPLERYMREAKALQIFEGTNQIQRVVIARYLTGA